MWGVDGFLAVWPDSSLAADCLPGLAGSLALRRRGCQKRRVRCGSQSLTGWLVCVCLFSCLFSQLPLPGSGVMPFTKQARVSGRPAGIPFKGGVGPLNVPTRASEGRRMNPRRGKKDVKTRGQSSKPPKGLRAREQPPRAFNRRGKNASRRQKTGVFWGIAAMGTKSGPTQRLGLSPHTKEASE